jgi:hypothetical protein
MNNSHYVRDRNMTTSPFIPRMAAALLLLLGAVSVCTSQHHVYQVTKDDYEYLQHYTLLAAFDSAVVSYVFGEVQVGSAGGSRRIRLDTLLQLDSMLYNGPGLGVQTTLMAALRTRSFVIDSSDETLWFHRELRSRNFSGITNAFTSAWRFMDVTEFVVQIVDDSSNSVLATVDSVGLDSTAANGTGNPPYYGTNVATWSRSASLPQDVHGHTVYVRVVPKRYGSTPYGLTASRIGSRMSRSLLYGCSETELSGDSISVHDSVRFALIVENHWDEFSEFCGVRGADYLELSSNQSDSLLGLFYVQDSSYSNPNGLRRFFPLTCEQAKARRYQQDVGKSSVVAEASSHGVRLRSTGQGSTVVLSWIDNRGALLTEQQTVAIAIEWTEVPAPMSLARGLYFARWIDPASNSIGTVRYLQQ